MLSFVADENFNQDIVRGAQRRIPELDIITVQEAGLSGADDTDILAWAARLGRVVLTHDVATMVNFAYERVIAGERMPGVFEVGRKVAIQTAIEEIVLLAQCSFAGEWEGQVRYIPLK